MKSGAVEVMSVGDLVFSSDSRIQVSSLTRYKTLKSSINLEKEILKENFYFDKKPATIDCGQTQFRNK